METCDKQRGKCQGCLISDNSSYVLSLVGYNERQNVVSLSPIITINNLGENLGWIDHPLKTVATDKPCNWTCKCPILIPAYTSLELNCNRNQICDA